MATATKPTCRICGEPVIENGEEWYYADGTVSCGPCGEQSRQEYERDEESYEEDQDADLREVVDDTMPPW